jgi:hypothetical protein
MSTSELYSDSENGYASDDPGHVVAVCPAAPGWWAVYGPPADKYRAPVAMWIVTESVVRLDPSVRHDGGRLTRYHTVYGVDATGAGWDGSPIAQDVEYVYEGTDKR